MPDPEEDRVKYWAVLYPDPPEVGVWQALT